ncbi:portal protein [Sphingomonas sp. J344]|uniref:portal protein n=1 Tax=Sphingomonas sp. J344 TaxID=2898434 RepID=UPI00215117FC|nr:portal protein [Sphingomonas sp. J344]MCR5870685.1 portal protein [Sphingomonas sp. J344]
MATAAQTYNRLSKARNTVLTSSREAARVTIPGLIPEEGSSDPHDVTEQPYTSVGARGVNNISAKLLVTMFPPERTFFRLDVDQDTAEEMGSKIGDVQAALAGISRKAMVLAELSRSRTIWMEVFRHLVVAGNVLVYHPDDGTRMRMWRLDQYVVRRNAQGDMIEAVIREEVYPSELEEAIRAAVEIEIEEDEDPSKASAKEERKVPLYTYIRRVKDQVEHWEEINDIEVPGSRGSVKVDDAGWQALRWQAVPGSDYGRSYVTEYAGDLLTLEDASQAILKFGAEAARILRIVDPNSGIDVEELATAESGDVLTGFADRIKTLQLDKSMDFDVLWSIAQSIERRLSQAFLLTTNAIRDAERVTAEEIRAIASELEDALGGTYTVLSSEVQRPYAQRLLYILSRQKKAPKLPPSVTPVIVTGFNALGQNHETAALRDWLRDLRETLGEAALDFLDKPEIAKRLGTGRGVQAVETLIKSPEAMEADQTNAAAGDIATAVAPQVAKGAMDAMAAQ